jgi:hypothetical protein
VTAPALHNPAQKKLGRFIPLADVLRQKLYKMALDAGE